MSDINLVVLSGCLTADAEFNQRPGGFIAVKLRLATSHKITKKDAPAETRKVYHNVLTTIDDKSHLVDYWKQRCRKGARLTIQGLLEMDILDHPDGNKRYHLSIKARPQQIVLPDAPIDTPDSQHQQSATTSPAPGKIPSKLADSSDRLHF